MAIFLISLEGEHPFHKTNRPMRARAFTWSIIRGQRKNEGNLNFKLIDYWALKGDKYGKRHCKPVTLLVCELLRVIYSQVKVLVTRKSSKLPSFWPLTPERKVQLTWSWSHFVGLIDPQPLKPFGKPSHVNRILL